VRIYRTDAGFEAKLGYTFDDPLTTQYARTLDLARQHADAFRAATAANPKFTPVE
jgi:hypothetical protein